MTNIQLPKNIETGEFTLLFNYFHNNPENQQKTAVESK